MLVDIGNCIMRSGEGISQVAASTFRMKLPQESKLSDSLTMKALQRHASINKENKRT